MGTDRKTDVEGQRVGHSVELDGCSTDRKGLCPELVLSERHSDGPLLSLLVGGLLLSTATHSLYEKTAN